MTVPRTAEKALTAYASEQQTMGYFRIFARPLGGQQTEITLFRGAPVVIGSVSTQDPFTEQTAQLSFPMITAFDTPGAGDLDWLKPNSNIDIVWQNVGGYDLDWRWEGFIASYEFNLSGADSTFTVDLKGALYALDDYLAVPTSPLRPIPYELLMAQDFDQDAHPASLGKFQILFPSDWDRRVPEFKDPNYLVALKPWGVHTNQRWTGFTSRSTGSWEPVLTGHVQSLLTVMFDTGGRQWSIRNLGRRRPQLFLRRIPDSDDDAIIEIYLGAPGVDLTASRDFTQRAGVIYGQGTDTAGITYSGIQVTPDGVHTYFQPFAYSPRLWPRMNNPNYDPASKPKETMIAFQQGVDEVSARAIAQAQYQRFAEPGITGTITLTTDPRLSDGSLMPRLMIRGGQTIRIHGLLGNTSGVMAHITQASADFTGLTTQLTYDTKYRDALTVQEVRARTRDSLTPLRALQVGKFTTTIQDLVLPWSYEAGSGIMPTPAKELFNQVLVQRAPTASFPYEDWTTQYPPSKNPSWYVKIGPTDPHNSNHNWASEAGVAIPIRFAQAGSIKLSQIAAYDKNGHVLPVKFHLSLYYATGLTWADMPQFPGPQQLANGNPNPDFPPYLAARRTDGTVIHTTYETNDTIAMSHPFFKDAWESINPDGTQGSKDIQSRLVADNAGLVVGWGNYYEPAGYSPGRFSRGATRTGILEDATNWTWDMASASRIHLDDPKENRKDHNIGQLFAMIYCDDQDDRPVYFLGRFFRQEPGVS